MCEEVVCVEVNTVEDETQKYLFQKHFIAEFNLYDEG